MADTEGLRPSDLRHHPLVAEVARLGRRLGLWAVGQFIEESLRSLWRTRAWSAFAVALIALSLATVGAFVLVAENLGGLVSRLASLEVSVYLQDGAAAEEVEAARAALAEAPGVVGMRYLSKDEALAAFRATNPELARVPELLGENPFPASFEVTLTREARSPEAVARFAAAAEAWPAVQGVSRDLALAERMLAASRVTRVVSAFLGGVLLLSALFTVSNVVKLTVYTRRDEVQLLRVVGATTGYVRGTFVTEGVLQGLLGSALGLGLLYLAYRLTRGYLAASGLSLLASLTTRYLSASSLLLIVAAGAALGAVGSWVPLRRVARM